MRSLLRPAGFDDLGLRRALSDRLLPSLVGAMAFLAALALAGVIAASSLAQRWQQGAGGRDDRPGPATGRARARRRRARDQVVAALRATPGVRSARMLTEDELAALLRPWLGSSTGRIAIPLPAVIEVRMDERSVNEPALAASLERAAPGTLVEEHDRWVRRLAVLARSLQACAALAIFVVGFVAVAVVTVATRAGLAARRDAIETVHGLGAPDGYIARRFAARATLLAAIGAAIGAAAALPAPHRSDRPRRPIHGHRRTGRTRRPPGRHARCALDRAASPAVIAAGIGWLTAQGTVRRWLRRLP